LNRLPARFVHKKLLAKTVPPLLRPAGAARATMLADGIDVGAAMDAAGRSNGWSKADCQKR
jgi:hypothetical protein